MHGAMLGFDYLLGLASKSRGKASSRTLQRAKAAGQRAVDKAQKIKGKLPALANAISKAGKRALDAGAGKPQSRKSASRAAAMTSRPADLLRTIATRAEPPSLPMRAAAPSVVAVPVPVPVPYRERSIPRRGQTPAAPSARSAASRTPTTSRAAMQAAAPAPVPPPSERSVPTKAQRTRTRVGAGRSDQPPPEAPVVEEEFLTEEEADLWAQLADVAADVAGMFEQFDALARTTAIPSDMSRRLQEAANSLSFFFIDPINAAAAGMVDQDVIEAIVGSFNFVMSQAEEEPRVGIWALVDEVNAYLTAHPEVKISPGAVSLARMAAPAGYVAPGTAPPTTEPTAPPPPTTPTETPTTTTPTMPMPTSTPGGGGGGGGGSGGEAYEQEETPPDEGVPPGGYEEEGAYAAEEEGGEGGDYYSDEGAYYDSGEATYAPPDDGSALSYLRAKFSAPPAPAEEEHAAEESGEDEAYYDDSEEYAEESEDDMDYEESGFDLLGGGGGKGGGGGGKGGGGWGGKGGGHHHHHGGHRGMRGGGGWWGGYGYPYYYYEDPLWYELYDDEEELADKIAKKVAQREWAAGRGRTHVGAYSIQSAQRQMDNLKNLTVAIARVMVRNGKAVASQTIDIAEGGLLQRSLPGIASLQKTVGHLDWHANELGKYTDPAAIYPNSSDLKKWTMQAFVDANAVEEGRATQELIWNAMWQEIGEELAKMPQKVVSAIVKLPGQVLEGVTGIPVWAWWVGGIAIIGLLGFGVWKIVMAAAPAVAGASTRRYLR